MSVPQRTIFWQIEHVWGFYVLAAVTIAIMLAGLGAHVRAWARAAPRPTLHFSRRCFRDLVWDGLLGRRILRGDKVAGFMHAGILWGFVGLFIGTILVAVDEYVITFLSGRAYLVFSFCLEVAGLLLLVGLAWALVRRYVQRVPRLERRWDGLVITLWLGAAALTGFIVETLRVAYETPDWEAWSFVAYGARALVGSSSAIPQIYPYCWWIHAIVSLGLVAAIPYTRLFHILAAPANIVVQDGMFGHAFSASGLDAGPGGDADSENDPELRDNVDSRGDTGFSWPALLAFEACTRCGRCVEVCPSASAGEPFSPRAFVISNKGTYSGRFAPLGRFTPSTAAMGARRGLAWFEDHRVWHCTTCWACVDACPVYVPIPSTMRTVRTRLVEDGTDLSPQLTKTLEKLFRYDNPWEASKKRRGRWAKGLEIRDLTRDKDPVDVCYFVGCTTSLDTRTQALARAFARILDNVGVAFGTLGRKEPCCGDIARRLGEEGLFEEQLAGCSSLLERYGVHQLVTSSPHCFHTLRNESLTVDTLETGDESAPSPKRQIRHYTELLQDLLESGMLKLERPVAHRITYHDPCYLGRHNQIYEAPRAVLRAIPGAHLVEMAHHGPTSLCCGGGGGRLWQEGLDAEIKMSEVRVREAVATGADILCTACPLCLIMLEDGRKTAGLEDSIRVLDLNELVVLGLGLDAPD